MRRYLVNPTLENIRRPRDNPLDFLWRIKLQSMNMPKPIAQRRRQAPRPRRRANHRKFWQIESHRSRRRTLADHDIEFIVLHRRVKHLLNRSPQPVNFIDKQHVTISQICQNARQIPRLFDRWTTRHADLRAHLIRNHRRHRRLAQPRRTIQQHMVHRLATFFRRLDRQTKISLQPLLSDIVIKLLRPERHLNDLLIRIVIMYSRIDNSLNCHMVLL